MGNYQMSDSRINIHHTTLHYTTPSLYKHWLYDLQLTYNDYL